MKNLQNRLNRLKSSVYKAFRLPEMIYLLLTAKPKLVKFPVIVNAKHVKHCLLSVSGPVLQWNKCLLKLKPEKQKHFLLLSKVMFKVLLKLCKELWPRLQMKKCVSMSFMPVSVRLTNRILLWPEQVMLRLLGLMFVRIRKPEKMLNVMALIFVIILLFTMSPMI